MGQPVVETRYGQDGEANDDDELKKALALSRQDIEVEDEEADLRRAIQLSMQGKLFTIYFNLSILSSIIGLL